MTVRDTHSKALDNLRVEDRILWDAVRLSTIPLRAANYKNAKRDKNQIQENSQYNYNSEILKSYINTGSEPQSVTSEVTSLEIYPFDRPTHKKISKGRIQIDGRVDLHGLIQSEAYSLLLHFLQSACYRGLRHVLVITGKGTSPGSEGALRHSVPRWLATPPFRQLVASFDDAARHHGGVGALYLRLRRKNSGIYL